MFAHPRHLRASRLRPIPHPGGFSMAVRFCRTYSLDKETHSPRPAHCLRRANWFPWLALFVICAAGLSLATDVVTYHNDIFRTGQNLQETILTLSNVNSSSFGKLFTMPVDNVIDAEPLYL